MQFTWTKQNGKYDLMTVVRDDGAQETVDCPKQRIIPHDMVHFAVESTLRKRGFLTRIKEGEAAGFGMVPNAESDGIERLVEVFQGDAWSGGATAAADMLDLYQVTCRERACPPLSVTIEDIEVIRTRIEELDREWQQLAVGSSLRLAM